MLKNNQLYILDGALATELEKLGADLNDPIWSAKVLLESPDLLKKVNLEYLKAGANFIITATYQATFEGLRTRGLSKAASIDFFNKSVRLATEVRDDFWSSIKDKTDNLKPIVTASIGPYGAYLADGSEYRGNYGLSDQALHDFHYQRMEVLATAGVELFAFETFPDLQEALVVTEILKNFPEKQAWLSFSCQDPKHISDGHTFAEVVKIFNNFNQIFAVGINCVPPDWVSPLLQSAQSIATKPFVVYPNGTGGWDTKHNCWIELPAHIRLESLGMEWCELGARIIGGCCRTSPQDIRAIQRNLRQRRQRY